MKPRRLLNCIVVFALLAAILSGCKSALPSLGNIEDVAPIRKARQAEFTDQFNRQRDKAEFHAALECYRRRDLSGCRDALGPVLKRNPEHIEAHLLMSDVLVAQNRGQEALATLEPLAKRYPQNAQLQHAMGRLWDNAGDTARALDCYERAARHEPHNQTYQLSCRTAARAAETVSVASVLEDGPTQWPGPGTSKAPAGHDASAERMASAESTDSPEVAGPIRTDPRLRAGLEALAGDRPDAALPLLEEVISANPHDPQVALSAAVAALRRNRPDMAIALVRPAIDRLGGSAALYRVLATAHYRRGEYHASQIALQQALSLDNSSPLSYFLMGCTLTRLGQAEAAAEYFGQARQMDPSLAAGL